MYEDGEYVGADPSEFCDGDCRECEENDWCFFSEYDEDEDDLGDSW